MDQTIRIAVIMAGGSGERFWPLSRQRRPKQLLRLASTDKTLLEEAIDRIGGLIPRKQVFVVTSRALVEPIRQAQTGVPDANILGEPAKRNTAGCLAYMAAHARARFGGAPVTMAVLTADQRIAPRDRFEATVRAAMETAENHGVLATIGVVPTRPETGYGYIEIAEEAQPLASTASELPVAYPVAAFREKPDSATAERFVDSGRFLWNSGMFFWSLDRFVQEIAAAAPRTPARSKRWPKP